MELDQLKSDWKSTQTSIKTEDQLQSMLLENKHPVLKGIRKQLAIEILGWSAFLFCYYTMFDGDKKPLTINLLLVATVLISLTHNIVGYNFSKYLVQGDNLMSSLTKYFYKIKQYAMISLASRVVFSAGLLTFFSYNITFTQSKYLMLLALVLVFMVQLYWMYSIWMKRIKTLKNSLGMFK